MIHVETKNALQSLFPRLKVKTYNEALESLIAHYRARKFSHGENSKRDTIPA
jgi:hypothetical protein